MVAMIKMHRSLVSKQTELHDDIYKEEVGMLARLVDQESKSTVIVDQIEENNKHIEELGELASSTSEDVAFLQGVVQKQDRQIQRLKNKVIDLTTKSMKNNIVISGWEGDNPDENCVMSVEKFFQDKLKMTFHKDDIHIAHRFGPRQSKNTEADSGSVCSQTKRVDLQLHKKP